MGFFSKIKQNLNHGGVKIDLQGPASVSMQEANVPVTVSVTNTGDQQQTIKSVRVEIVASSQDQAFQQPDSNVNSQPQVNDRTVAQVDNNESFAVMPGETKTVQLSLVMNAGAAAATQLPEGSAMAQVAGAFQKMQSLSETMNNRSYTYSLKASANIEGITLGPAKEYPLQVLKPGQIGGAANFHL